MKKMMLIRGLYGFPSGVTIGVFISLFVSWCIGDGRFYPVNPDLVAALGTEWTAVLVQLLVCGMIGMVGSAASVIWLIDHWSLARQSCLNFIILFMLIFLSGYFLSWFPLSLVSFIVFTLTFTLIFLIVWITEYLLLRHKIKNMNERMRIVHGENK